MKKKVIIIANNYDNNKGSEKKAKFQTVTVMTPLLITKRNVPEISKQEKSSRDVYIL